MKSHFPAHYYLENLTFEVVYIVSCQQPDSLHLPHQNALLGIQCSIIIVNALRDGTQYLKETQSYPCQVSGDIHILYNT